MESSSDKVGVMAGYLVPTNQICTIRKELDEIRTNYFTGGKVHISELSPYEQASVRSDIFTYLKKNHLCCVYEAVSVEGFLSYYKKLNQHLEKINNFKDCLHYVLFQGIFGYASAYLYDNIGNEFFLKVISDNIDKGILKRFKKEAAELLFLEEPKERTWRKLTPDSKQIDERTLSLKVKDRNNILGDFSGIKYSIEIEDSGLTLASDVLANSINHHLSTRNVEIIGTGLMTIDAVKGHPMYENIYGLSDSSEITNYSDIFYNKKIEE